MREMRESPQLGSLRLLVRFIILSALLSAGAAALCVLTAALAGVLSPGPAVWAAALAVPAAFGAVTALLAGRYFNRRFRRLRDSFQTIIDGDLSVRLPVEGSGAFSAAYADFNRMAEELQNVRARRDEYVNTFTHEFKTPLTAIRGFAELLQEPGFTEAEQKKYLQIIASESTQLAELANDALLLTKLETGNLPVSRTTFWLDEQVSHCLLLLEGSAREKAQTLTADIAPVEFTGSVELLPHVWNNLVGNAIKYTPNGGHIRVSLQRQGDTAVFTVADDGIGMSDEVRSHIFDRYYQADPAHTRRGIGLGLPIVHSIVSLCGGRIQVESTPGAGSTFRVLLPGAGTTEAAGA